MWTILNNPILIKKIIFLTMIKTVDVSISILFVRVNDKCINVNLNLSKLYSITILNINEKYYYNLNSNFMLFYVTR